MTDQGAQGNPPAAERITYCRICPASCGLVATVSPEGSVVSVRGDAEHPLTGGYTCEKGRNVVNLHRLPTRYLASQRRGDEGRHESVGYRDAVADIGRRLEAIRDEHGPDAIGMFVGTQAAFATLTVATARAWFKRLGSHKLFSTMTIDQSAKWLRQKRLGDWAAGRQRFDEADVWMIIGSNPIVTMQGGDFTGVPIQNVSRTLADERKRGIRLIVIDPRRSETAAKADLHLQLIPGTDAVLIAGILNTILVEGLHDRDFSRRYSKGIDKLRRNIEMLTPQTVSTLTGVDAGDIVHAARLFAFGPKGMAMSGTGPNMGPDSNVAEHLIGVLNVVCGRFPRAGDRIARDGVLVPTGHPQARVIPPIREWEVGFQSRIGNYGTLNGELPSAILPAEITETGRDKLRALIVVGGNPAAVLPEQRTAVTAFGELDLLVTLEPFPTETARLAHYVIAPAMSLERADHTGYLDSTLSAAFAQYTPAVLRKPENVVEDWQFFADLAAEMNMPIKLAGRIFNPDEPRPSAAEYLAWTAERGRVPLAEVQANPHGRRFDDLDVLVADAADHDEARFDLLPDDVKSELDAAITRQRVRSDRPLLLTVRRNRQTMNTFGRQLASLLTDPPNPCFVHPSDLTEIGAEPGQLVRIESDYGTVTAVCQSDATLRRGSVSITHGYGATSRSDAGDPRTDGTNVALLLSLTEGAQKITGMPWMTAVPVRVTAIA
jgi:anaerobic selenocysteine-containing dehydrogenase